MKTTILKIAREEYDVIQALTSELSYQDVLTTQQQFELMFRKSREIAEMLRRHGYRKPLEFIKRT